MATFGTAFGSAAAYNPNKSAEVPSPPSDGVSSLKFSPASNLLVATSWSGQVLCWDVQSNGQAIPKAAITSDKPVLCSAWSADGSTVFAGACWGLQGECGGQQISSPGPGWTLDFGPPVAAGCPAAVAALRRLRLRPAAGFGNGPRQSKGCW